MKKRIISLILIFVMTIGLMPTVTFAANGADFAGGSGTEADPYLISTKTHLNNVRKYLNAHFKMTCDIEFTDADFKEGGDFYNSGKGFASIGTDFSPAFTGCFDGNGYAIKNLYVKSTSNYAGLFGYNKGTIKNLGLLDGNISSSSSSSSLYVGGITGYNYSASTITNCYNTGSVSATSSSSYSNAGGIAGYNDYGTITNCYNTGSVSSSSSLSSNSCAGGIAGYNYKGTITNCYNTGIVYSSNYVAGGITSMNSGSIENCFNTGFIRAELGDDNYYCYAGGICGTNHNIITACYNVGQIKSASRKGGITALIVDIGNPDAKIENSYYLVDDNQGVGIDDDGATKCKKEHMVLQSTFSGFDFENIWTISDSSDYLYPELIENNMNFTKNVQGYTILSLPNKTEYYVGIEDFDITGAKLAKIYNDGTIEEISIEPYMVSGYDKTQIGKQTITITYSGEKFTFNVTNLSLIYDYKLTTDEMITLEFSAKKEFEFVLSDETAAKITNIQTSKIQWGSSIQITSAATISPLKPGYVVVSVIDNIGNILTESLLLIEEGKHQFILSEVLKEASCTEEGEELYICKFCECQEKKPIPVLEHTYENDCDTTCDCGYVREITHDYKAKFDTQNHFDKCTVCGDVINSKPHKFDNACDTTCDCGYIREITHDYKDTYNAAGHFEECTICGSIGDGAPHEFDNACDKTCDCGYTRITTHKYDNACDKDCNVCKELRTVPAHVYDNACDKDCNVCKVTRTVEPHKYDNAFDAKCNVCGAERTAPNTPTRNFVDVPANAWYKQFVDYAVAYGLFSGTSESTFSPSADMTRAQFVQVLANIAGVKLDNNVSTGFSDAPAGKWFTGAVKWATSNGIASGVGNGQFNPTGKIDRQQMCMMLVNYVENYKKTSLKEKVSYKTFADDKDIAGWAKTAVIKCFKAGLVSGTGNNMFSPKVVANRATGATIFTNFHKEYIA